MRRFFMGAVVAALAAFGAAPQALASYDDFVGTWSTTSPGDGGLVSLDIRRSGGTVTVQVGAQCSPRPCDWGRVNAVAYAPNASANLRREANTLVAVYNQGFATKTVVITLAGGGRLNVNVFTQFSSGDGRTNYTQASTFQRGGGGGSAEGVCVDVNPRWGSLRVRETGGGYAIMQGGSALAVFESQEEAAYARLLIVSYTLNQKCVIGTEDLSFEYWTNSGNIPNGAMLGEDCIAFNPANLRARRSGGMWRVQDGSSILYAMETREEAEAVIAFLQESGARRSCFVGRPDPGMSYVRR